MKQRKKFAVILAVLAMLFVMSTVSFAKSDAKIIAPKGTPAVDGEVDDIWQKADAQSVDKVDKVVIPSKSTTTGTVRTMWDENYFYVLVEVDKHGIQVYQGEGGAVVDVDYYDCAEVTFSMTGNFGINGIQNCGEVGTGDVRVFPDGTMTGFGPYFDDVKENIVAVMKVTDTDKYVAEYAFPWAGCDPVDGHVLSMEIQINDHSKPARDGLVNWASTTGCWGWNQTDVHGEVILGDENSVVPVTTAPVTEPAEETTEDDTSADTTAEVTEPTVSTEAGTEAKTEARTEAPVTTSAPAVDSDGTPIGLIIGIIAAVIVIAAVVIILVKKKK